MALYSLHCADVPLSNCSFTHSQHSSHTHPEKIAPVNDCCPPTDSSLMHYSVLRLVERPHIHTKVIWNSDRWLPAKNEPCGTACRQPHPLQLHRFPSVWSALLTKLAGCPHTRQTTSFWKQPSIRQELCAVFLTVNTWHQFAQRLRFDGNFCQEVSVTHRVASSPSPVQDCLRNGDMHDIQGGPKN